MEQKCVARALRHSLECFPDQSKFFLRFKETVRYHRRFGSVHRIVEIKMAAPAASQHVAGTIDQHARGYLEDITLHVHDVFCLASLDQSQKHFLRQIFRI